MGADAILYKPAALESILRALRGFQEKKVSIRRKSPRLKSSFTVQFQLSGDGPSYKARALNVGPRGMFISLKEFSPPLGTEIQFTAEVSFSGRIQGTGIVRWISPGNFRIPWLRNRVPGARCKFR